MVLPPADARLRLRISAVSGGVRVTAEPRTDVVVDAAAPPWRPPTERSRSGRAAVEVGRREVPGGRRRRRRHPLGRRRARGRFGTVGVTSQSGSIRVARWPRPICARSRASSSSTTCEGRCRISTTSGRITVGADRRCGDLHDVGIGRRRRRGGYGPGAIGQRHGQRRLGGAAGRSMPAPSPARSRSACRPACAPRCGTSGRGTVRSSFEPGDDVLVDVASVSGTVRLVPA